jgi:hypothetical protein
LYQTLQPLLNSRTEVVADFTTIFKLADKGGVSLS